MLGDDRAAMDAAAGSTASFTRAPAPHPHYCWLRLCKRKSLLWLITQLTANTPPCRFLAKLIPPNPLEIRRRVCAAFAMKR